MKLAEYRKVSPALYADLKTIIEKHGFIYKPGRAVVDERVGIVKLTLELADANLTAPDGTATNPDALRYLVLCRHYTELKPEWLNDTFSSGGHVYRLAGYTGRRGKNAFLIERQADKSRRVTSEEQIILHFNAKAARAAKPLEQILGATENVGSTPGVPKTARPLGELLNEK